MIDAVLAMTMSLALLAPQIQATPSKAPPPDAGPGRIVWFDISTSDLAASKKFYGKLFEWTFTPLQGSDMAV